MSERDSMDPPDGGGAAPGLEEAVLYRSEDLLVRAVAAGGGGTAFITFDSYTDTRTLERPGFGEHFFRSRRMDAVHVISRENRWYQDPGIDEVLGILRHWSSGYDRVITYGSSMGGFAALHFGGTCGAQAGLALSPQFSVDPSIAPFEDRWKADVERIKFRSDLVFQALPQQYIAYDPLQKEDARHYDLFARRSPTSAIRAPYGGHPVGAFLNEAGVLVPLLEKVASDALDEAEIASVERTLRDGRRRSGQYLFSLAQRIPERRMKQRLALAAMAVAAQPADPVYLSFYAATLDEAGRPEEAYPLHLASMRLPTAGVHQTWRLMMHHRLRGALAEAEALGQWLVDTYPQWSLALVTLEGVRRERRLRTRFGRFLERTGMEGMADYIARRWHRHLAARFSKKPDRPTVG